MEKKQVIYLAIVTILVCIPLALIFRGAEGFHILLIMGFLIVMSYTDIQTGTVYTIFSFLLIMAEALILVVHFFKGGMPEGMDGITCLCMIIYLFLNLAAGRLELFGMGDVYIFSVLALFYCNTGNFPLCMIFVSLFLASLFFQVRKFPHYFKGMHCKKQLPFTAEIAAASFITILLFLR